MLGDGSVDALVADERLAEVETVTVAVVDRELLSVGDSDTLAASDMLAEVLMLGVLPVENELVGEGVCNSDAEALPD